MLDLTLDLNFVLFANYRVPSQLLQPLIPAPLLLDKIIRRFRYYSYVSAVVVSYRGLRFGDNYIPLHLLQLNYRTYVQLYMKPSLFILHSFVTGIPSKLLALSQLPLSPLWADVVIESRDPDGWPGRLRVDGSTETAPLAIHLDRGRVTWPPQDPEMIASLADRELAIFRRSNGQWLFLKASHPPLKVQSAFPLLLSLPATPSLPYPLGGRAPLDSVWITGPVEFKLDLSSSLTLDLLGYFIQHRLPLRHLSSPEVT